jgi:hypothetical protein
MQAGNISHKSLARAVVAAAARPGEAIACDHTYVSRWLKGAIPRGNMPQFIAEALGQKVGRRLTLDDIGMGEAAVSAVQPDLGLELADRPEATAKTVTDLWRAELAGAGRTGQSTAGLRRLEHGFPALDRRPAGRRADARG